MKPTLWTCGAEEKGGAARHEMVFMTGLEPAMY
jgi:hypothetical protein